MSAFEVFLSSVLFVVAIAEVSDIDSLEDSVIDDIIINGNESLFSAFIIMKNNEETEETIVDSTEVKDIESISYGNNEERSSRENKENVEYFTNYGETVSNPDGLLRKKPFKGCLKKASKVCTKSCKAAVKDACDYYDCKKKLKKGLKKECKRSCKRNFIGD